MDNTAILNSINNLNIANVKEGEILDEELLQQYTNRFENFVIDKKYEELLNTFISVEDVLCNNLTKCAILYVGSQFVEALVNAEENNC